VQSRTSSEREVITLQDLLHFQQFQNACSSFPTDMVIELIYGSQIEFEISKKFLELVGIESNLKNAQPKI
jgi:hypothetical protein